MTLADCGISKLEAEPQEGPTEYKLHLLLRPRRSFSAASTGRFVSGSHLSRLQSSTTEAAVNAPRVMLASPSVPTLQSRQNRLQHLTTQLLWRLQQSSPYHSSSTADLVLPRLPEATAKLGAPPRAETLLPGLEESRGALYEIGVSDDGTFVGLTEDEMHESLTNLRAMAASLGCKVDILRTVIVGNCKWNESVSQSASSETLRHSNLLVAEVLILPETDVPVAVPALVTPLSGGSSLAHLASFVHEPSEEDCQTEQLRVSLTGSTTSGKSSLLGTLSTSTLDNGRGKSRLSLLKHRHEIASGITSSVAPELIGYRSSENSNGKQSNSVVNYGRGNVSSWNDIHNAAEGGRLVFLIDSAGHPRYRRTTVRGLISWAPHWTLCCVAADERTATGVSIHSEDAKVLDIAGELSRAHLELCLKLDISLVVVITKYDLASKTSLRTILAKVLSIIKDAGRKPVPLKPRLSTDSDDLHNIYTKDEREVQSLLTDSSVVPIVLTSAVTGGGIGQVHALLRHLPIPQSPHANLPQYQPLETIFHVDEVYTKPSLSNSNQTVADENKTLLVLSGHLRYGMLSIGSTLQLGPFFHDALDNVPAPEMHRARSYPSRLSIGNGHNNSPGAGILPRALSGDFSTLSTAQHTHQEFIPARVVSVRNLRLPLRRLRAGQAGTVGIELFIKENDAVGRVRKGMILGSPLKNERLSSCAGFVGRFGGEDYHVMRPGGMFNVYVASVRASAKIITVEAVDAAVVGKEGSTKEANGLESMFGFDEDSEIEQDYGRENANLGADTIDVSFQLVSCREWIEVGAQVLVMPANAVEKSVGLDGFVGKVVDTLE